MQFAKLHNVLCKIWNWKQIAVRTRRPYSNFEQENYTSSLVTKKNTNLSTSDPENSSNDTVTCPFVSEAVLSTCPENHFFFFFLRDSRKEENSWSSKKNISFLPPNFNYLSFKRREVMHSTLCIYEGDQRKKQQHPIGLGEKDSPFFERENKLFSHPASWNPSFSPLEMSCQEDLISMGWPDITLGIILDVGTVASNIPQVKKEKKNLFTASSFFLFPSSSLLQRRASSVWHTWLCSSLSNIPHPSFFLMPHSCRCILSTSSKLVGDWIRIHWSAAM